MINFDLPPYHGFFNCMGKYIHITPVEWDEEFEQIKQMESNGQRLIFGKGEYPIAIEGDPDDMLGRIGLKDRIMNITYTKYIESLKKIHNK